MFGAANRTLMLLVGALFVAACGGGDGGDAGVVSPMVDRIPDALAAVEEHYGSPPAYFEVSARIESVGFVVAVDGATAAEQGSWTPEGGLEGPEPVGEASGSTFTADVIDLDPDLIFDEIRAELGDPAIIDLALQGSAGGGVIYDASIAGDNGGVLLVLLGPDGSIRAVQGQ